ncbi:hypothetical protein, partial [Rhodobacter capsulatus]|uniref:hypothetical protein n=1 Tax=Rhodobacter capsulatus TaxID=1061 RepID=UPI0019D6E79F
RAANPSILIAANHPRNPFKAWEFSHSTPDSIPANLLNYPKAEKLNQLITQQQTNEMNRSGSATSSSTVKATPSGVFFIARPGPSP